MKHKQDKDRKKVSIFFCLAIKLRSQSSSIRVIKQHSNNKETEGSDKRRRTEDAVSESIVKIVLR